MDHFRSMANKRNGFVQMICHDNDMVLPIDWRDRRKAEKRHFTKLIKETLVVMGDLNITVGRQNRGAERESRKHGISTKMIMENRTQLSFFMEYRFEINLVINNNIPV